MEIYILVCMRKEFGADTCQTWAFRTKTEAVAAEAGANVNCDGWHSLHVHIVECE